MKQKTKLNVFICPAHRAVVTAYNRGHAVQLLAKRLHAERGITLLKSDEVIKLVAEQPQAILLDEQDDA